MKAKQLAISIMVSLWLAAGSPVFAQEHPEHPKGGKEHPEHPTAETKVSTAGLEKEIKAQIAKKEEKDGGVFKLADDVTKTIWDLKLDKVHSDRLSQLDESTYFACVDFKTKDGKTIDVDFFMVNEKGTLKMKDTTIHKVEGKPRYNWEEKDGFWKRVELKKD